MPLFVFISGFLSHKNSTKKFWAGCLKLLEPLVILQVLTIGYDYFTGEEITVSRLLTPWWFIWYLLSLVCWRTMLHILPPRILNHSKWVILSAFVIGIIADFLPFDRLLSIQRTLALLPFFFWGYYMQTRNICLSSRYKPFCFMFLCFAFVLPVFLPEYLGDLRFADRYPDISFMYSRILVFCVSIAMSVSFLCVCPDTRFLSKQGRYTLQYYIYHTVIVYFLMIIVRKLNLPDSALAALVYTIFVTFVIWIFSHFSFFVKLTNPSVYLRNKKWHLHTTLHQVLRNVLGRYFR